MREFIRECTLTKCAPERVASGARKCDVNGATIRIVPSTSFRALDPRSDELGNLLSGIDALGCWSRWQLQHPHIDVLSRLNYRVDAAGRGRRESLIAENVVLLVPGVTIVEARLASAALVI